MSSGSTATILSDGLRGFSTWPTPVIVPPVPTPETKMSISPSVSFQISSAVVRRWISGLAGFSNCCGMTAPGISALQLLGLGDRALHALRRLASARARRRGARSILRRSSDIVSGIDQDQPVARAAATKASAMPVLPEVGSTSVPPGLIAPAASSASIMLTPMRSLTLAIGLKNSSLARMSASTPCSFGEPVEAHQRRVADRLGDRIVDAAAAGRAGGLGVGELAGGVSHRRAPHRTSGAI